MRLIKPRFWKTKNFFSFILYPFSAITYLINISKKFSIKKNFEIKTICIGNIFVGGTGKTSLAIEINELLGKKFKTVFIKKNYKNQLDEINLLNSKGKIIFSTNRKNALLTAINKKYQVAIFVVRRRAPSTRSMGPLDGVRGLFIIYRIRDFNTSVAVV